MSHEASVGDDGTFKRNQDTRHQGGFGETENMFDFSHVEFKDRTFYPNEDVKSDAAIEACGSEEGPAGIKMLFWKVF